MNSDYDVVRIVREFLRIDTSNPPGNEEVAILFLEDMLRKEGAECSVYSPAAGRANLLARIEGKQKGKPVILLSHIDVVPAKDEEWDVDPFGGELIDGFVYGRGTIDMKSQAICQLLAFLRYHAEGLTPERDLVLLATCDEEVGGAYGVDYMLREVPYLKGASFVLSEGGCIRDDDGLTHAQISVAEKKLSQFTVRATGTGGHGSIPHQDNANEKVIRACARILSGQWPLKTTAITTAYLNGIFHGKTIGGYHFTNLREALRDKRFCSYVEGLPLYNALLRNTVTSTILKGGDKVNVIPTEATAQFDARLLPGESREAFLSKIARLSGPDVEVTPVDKAESVPLSTGYNSTYFKGIKAVTKGLKGKSFPVLPYITTGASDLRYFRALGIPSYGFFPITLTSGEFLRMHGRNERISVENIEEGLRGTHEIVKFLASQRIL